MKRPFLFIGGGFLLGCFLSSYLLTKQLIIIILLLILISILSLFNNTKVKKCTLTFVLFCVIGISMINIKDFNYYNKIIKLDNSTQTISATIKNIRQTSPDKFSYELFVNDIKDNNIKNFNTVLYTNKEINANLYDNISLYVKFFKPSKSAYFNGVNYYKSKNIYLLSSNYDYSEVTNIKISKNLNKPFMYYIKTYNNYLSNVIDENFSINSASIIKSMILGNSDDIPYSLKSKYNDTGTSHIFAISGLHIGILSLLIIKLTKTKGFLLRTLSPVIPIIFYILLSGCHLSSIRSGIMLLILVLSKLSLRKSDLLNTLFLTGFIIVISNVYAIMDIGFCMSFLATLGIILFSNKLERFFITRCKFYNFSSFAIKCICVSISATLLLMPFWIYLFKTINILSPLINLSISVFPSIILTLSFIYIFICPFIPHSFINNILSLIISIQNSIIDIFDKTNIFNIGLDYEIFNKWFIFSIIIILTFVIFKKSINFKLKHACICIFLSFMISNIFVMVENMNYRVYVIGDNSISNMIICDKNTTTVISTSDNDYIDILTTNFLKGKGINKIDNFIISYSNVKQYNDTLSLIDSFKITNIFFNKHNSNAFHILSNNKPKSSILPIEDTLKIKINNKLKINFSYIRKNININIANNNSNIFICDKNSVNNQRPNTLFFVRENSLKDYNINKNLVFSLKKPYDYKKKDVEYSVLNPMYNKNSTFIIK